MAFAQGSVDQTLMDLERQSVQSDGTVQTKAEYVAMTALGMRR